MLAVEEARARVVDAIRARDHTERIPAAGADGRYLAVPPVARLGNPAFDNSAMDGFAVRTTDLDPAGGGLPVAFTVAAGDAAGRLPAGACARIMTGAPVPEGADAVVMQEKVETAGDSARFPERPPVGDHIRRAGEDIAVGQALAAAGERVGPALISALITAGVAEVEVVTKPRVFVLSTGSELRDPDAEMGPGQIPDSNRPALLAELARLGVEPVDGGRVADDIDSLRAVLARGGECDAILTSGGVSVGAFDHVKQVLGEAGEIGFWKVAIKPGKPFAFGRLGGAYFFGLPGNPVSALVTFQQFVRPALIRLMGGTPAIVRTRAEAAAGFERSHAARTEFLRARLRWDGGRLLATPLSRQGSGMVGGMSRAHGYVVLEAGSHGFAAGDPVVVEPAGDWCGYGEPRARGEE